MEHEPFAAGFGPAVAWENLPPPPQTHILEGGCPYLDRVASGEAGQARQNRHCLRSVAKRGGVSGAKIPRLCAATRWRVGGSARRRRAAATALARRPRAPTPHNTPHPTQSWWGGAAGSATSTSGWTLSFPPPPTLRGAAVLSPTHRPARVFRPPFPPPDRRPWAWRGRAGCVHGVGGWVIRCWW